MVLLRRNACSQWVIRTFRWRNCIQPREYRFVQSWRAFYRLRLNWAFNVEEAVNQATHILLHKDDTPKCLLDILGSPQDLYEKDFSAACIIDELYSYLTPRQDPPLSQQYYSLELLKLFKVESLKKNWEKLVARYGDVDLVPLEDGIHFVSETRNPLEDYRTVDVDKSMNEMCNQVMERLKDVNECIFNKAQSLSLPTRPKKPLTSPWSAEETAVLVKTIVRVVVQYYIADSDDDRYTYYLEELLADSDRRAGIVPCNLMAACMAERLSVHCKIMLCTPPTHKFLLGFISKRGVGEDEEDEWAYIDMTRLRDKEDSIEFYDLSDKIMSRQLLSPTQPATVMQTLIQYSELQTNVERNLLATQITFYLDPENFNLGLRLMMYYFKHRINVAEAFKLREDLEEWGADLHSGAYGALADQAEGINELEIPSDIPILSRSDPQNKDVRYSIGMVMYHTRWEYDCVIVSWSPKCVATWDWIVQMGVDRLPRGPGQPFYNVLVPDGSQRYAAQENLTYHASPHPINHPEVGRYMKSFEGTYYAMNDALAKHYPDDLELTAEVAESRYRSHQHVGGTMNNQ